MRFIFLSVLTFSLFLIQQQSVQAQTAPQVGSYWNSSATLPSGPLFLFTTYVTNDSIGLDGSQFFNLEEHRTGYGIGSILNKKMEIRNDSVFYDGAFYFDYNPAIGDTINNNISSYYYLVDSLSTITIGTDTLNEIHTKKYHNDNTGQNDVFCQNVVFVEIIGPINHPFYIWTPHSGTPCIENSWTINPYFYCFHLDSSYNYPSSISCSPTVFVNNNVSINQLKSNTDNISVSPNPFSEQTTFEIKSNTSYTQLDLKLFDTTGRQIKHLNTKSSHQIILPRENLKSGLYFYQIIGNGQVIDVGKVMIMD